MAMSAYLNFLKVNVKNGCLLIHSISFPDTWSLIETLCWKHAICGKYLLYSLNICKHIS